MTVVVAKGLQSGNSSQMDRHICSGYVSQQSEKWAKIANCEDHIGLGPAINAVVLQCSHQGVYYTILQDAVQIPVLTGFHELPSFRLTPSHIPESTHFAF